MESPQAFRTMDIINLATQNSEAMEGKTKPLDSIQTKLCV